MSNTTLCELFPSKSAELNVSFMSEGNSQSATLIFAIQSAKAFLLFAFSVT
jgi:hypothetical protein